MAPLLDVGLPMLLVLAGVSLMVMEALAPGAHFIVIGIALLAAGLLGLTFGPLATPIALAAMVAAFGALTFFIYREFDFYGGKGTAQTTDSGSLTGARGWVTERVTATEGEVKLENGGFDPHFAARSFDEEIGEGEEVIVVDPGGGNVLTVAPLSAIETDEIDRELARATDSESDAADDAGGAEEEASTETESRERD